MQEADSAYLRGAPLGTLESFFVAAAQSQDEEARVLGLDKFGLRLIGSRWGGAIGHLGHLDTVAKLASLGLLQGGTRHISLPVSANSHYLAYWSDFFPTLRLSNEHLIAMNTALRALQDTVGFLRLRDGVTALPRAITIANQTWGDRPPLLKLSPEDLHWGQKGLETLGLDSDAWFVTFHIRKSQGPETRSTPNATVANYIPAMREVLKHGGVVVRIGDSGMPPLPPIDGILDLAHSKKNSGRLNTYALAAPRFMVGTVSGPPFVSSSFGVPLLYSNVPNIANVPFLRSTLSLPKHFVETRSGREIPLEEAAQSPLARSPDPTADDGLLLMENSKEEIVDAVNEMISLTGAGEFPDVPTRAQQDMIDAIAGLAGDHSYLRICESYLRR